MKFVSVARILCKCFIVVFVVLVIDLVFFFVVKSATNALEFIIKLIKLRLTFDFLLCIIIARQLLRVVHWC